MEEDQNIEQSQQDRKSESQEEVNKSILQERSIEQLQTKNMEVHHHPDLHHKKKHWKEYFLEFLMIFLAVTLGFFADSYREYLGDRSKEKEYMKSLIVDLKYDTAQFNNDFSSIIQVCANLDSCYSNITNAASYNYILEGKWYFNIWFLGYVPAMPTIQQLQNSGNLRLIQNELVSKQLVIYQSFIQGVLAKDQTGPHNAVLEIYELTSQFCNLQKMATTSFKGGDFIGNDMPIIIKDNLKLNQYANEYMLYKGHVSSYYSGVKDAKTRATQLLQLIQKEYNIQ